MPTVTRFDCALGSGSQETLPQLLARRPLGCTCLQDWSYGSYGNYSACANPGHEWPVPWCVNVLLQLTLHHYCARCVRYPQRASQPWPQVQCEHVGLPAGRYAMLVRHRPMVRNILGRSQESLLNSMVRQADLNAHVLGPLALMLPTGGHVLESATTRHSALRWDTSSPSPWLALQAIGYRKLWAAMC